MRAVLGIDVASATWADNGSAEVGFDAASFLSVVPAAIRWPTGPLTPAGLASAIDRYARDRRIVAVSLDGPQGWRDPQTPEGTPGVGRRCEYACRTQGKTGPYGITYPSTQRGWIEFSIAVFDELLRKPGVVLANDMHPSTPGDGYVVLECFPTSAWRASGLPPLPGKAKRPPLAPYVDALSRAYGLPSFTLSSHDDLQAVVAALCGAGVVRGPLTALRRGRAASDVIHGDDVKRRVEGLIWDAEPRGGPAPAGFLVLSPGSDEKAPPVARLARAAPHSSGRGIPLATSAGATTPSVSVTQGVLDQIARRQGTGAMMIALRGMPGGTKAQRLTVSLIVEGEDYVLIVGDSHAAWRSHQTAKTMESFETLFGRLADRPNDRVGVDGVQVLPDCD